jgi:hypothetical protein
MFAFILARKSGSGLKTNSLVSDSSFCFTSSCSMGYSAGSLCYTSCTMTCTCLGSSSCHCSEGPADGCHWSEGPADGCHCWSEGPTAGETMPDDWTIVAIYNCKSFILWLIICRFCIFCMLLKAVVISSSLFWYIDTISLSYGYYLGLEGCNKFLSF